MPTALLDAPHNKSTYSDSSSIVNYSNIKGGDIVTPEEDDLLHEVKDVIGHEVTSSMTLEETERETIRRSLERNGGRRKATAQELNISERTLYRKIKEYGLE